MSASRSPMCTHRDGSANRSVACFRFSSQRRLSFCSIGMRVGLTVFFRGVGALGLLAGPELDGRQAQRDPLGSQHRAGMHEHSTGGVDPVTTLDHRDLADRLGVISREAELGRVVQDQRRPGGPGEAGLGGREVPGQDEALIDSLVAEESIGGLGGGPVLAGHRDGGADPPSQVAEELCQARLEPLVGELAAIQLAIHPIVHAGNPGMKSCRIRVGPGWRL